MNESLFFIGLIAGGVFLVGCLVSTVRESGTHTWQDSMRGGMHMKDCGDCAARRPCPTRDSWEVQR